MGVSQNEGGSFLVRIIKGGYVVFIGLGFPKIGAYLFGCP